MHKQPDAASLSVFQSVFQYVLICDYFTDSVILVEIPPDSRDDKATQRVTDYKSAPATRRQPT